MNILFLHGMASSHASPIATYLREYMPEATVWAPDLSIDPERAFPQIERFLAEYQIDLIVGHSLGGFMAQKLRGRKKVLLNPSLGMDYLYLFIGDNKYKEERADGVQTWHVERRMCDTYKEMERTQYDNLTPEEDAMTVGIFGKRDLLTRMASHWFKKHYSQWLAMPGGHYPPEEAIRDYVVPEIRRLLNE